MRRGNYPILLLVAILAATCLCESHSLFRKASEVHCMTEDGRAWMEVVRDSDDYYLIGHVRNTADTISDTLALGHEMLRVNPKGVYAIDGKDGDTRYLFIYSRGNIFFWDEAVVYVAGKDGTVRRGVFQVDGSTQDEVDVMWWDARVDACKGYPPELVDYPDFEKHGIRFDPEGKRLYVPVMDSYGPESEFSGCPIYTGHYSIVEFDGREFVYIGDE